MHSVCPPAFKDPGGVLRVVCATPKICVNSMAQKISQAEDLNYFEKTYIGRLSLAAQEGDLLYYAN